jgi:hypothetical protein
VKAFPLEDTHLSIKPFFPGKTRLFLRNPSGQHYSRDLSDLSLQPGEGVLVWSQGLVTGCLWDLRGRLRQQALHRPFLGYRGPK